MHSSRMRTGHSLTVCCSLLPWGGVPGPGGWCVWSGGGLLLGGSVCSWGGAWSGEGGLLPGGWVPGLGGYPSMH